MTEFNLKVLEDTILTKEDLELAKKFAEEKNIPIRNGLTVADKIDTKDESRTTD